MIANALLFLEQNKRKILFPSVLFTQKVMQLIQTTFM